MGRFSRVSAQVFKNYKLMHNPWRTFDVTIWPLVLFFSIVLFASFIGVSGKMLSAVVLGLIGWRCVYHFHVDLVTSHMDEYWDNSLPFLMASPIRRAEFVAGGVITAAAKFIIVFTLFSVLGSLLFGFYISDPMAVLISLLALAAFGIASGVLALGLIYAFGRVAFPAAYSLPDVLVIFTGVYYPISVFPEPLRSAAQLLPSTYAFEALRSTLGMGSFNPAALLVTVLAFAVVAVLFNTWAFEYARRRGSLARLG